MSPATAATVLDVIALAGLVLWGIAARKVRRTRAELREPGTVEVDVRGDGAEAAVRFASALATAPIGTPLGGSRVATVDAQGLEWSNPGPLRHRGTLHIVARTPGRLRASVATGGPLVIVALLVNVFGLALLAGLYLLLGRFVVDSPEPAVRSQVVQMVQCVHGLWPPFLLCALARRQRVTILRDVERLLRATGVPLG